MPGEVDYYEKPMRYLAFGLVLLLGGCATTSVGVEKLQRKLENLAQKEEENQRLLDELATRLDLLADKVDTERVARESSGKPPRLPVIRIKPTEPEDERQAEAVTKPPSLIDQKSVVYAGEAKKNGPRPVLRLYGTDSDERVAGSRVETRTQPRPTAADRLKVVPLPRRRVAAAVARSDNALEHYRKARASYQAGQVKEAIVAFSSFVKDHGAHQYADNALYWLGECYYDTREYQKASATFRQVVEQYPKGNKVPDAMLKLAYCHVKLGEKRNACSVVRSLAESYPRSGAAGLARKTLPKCK